LAQKTRSNLAFFLSKLFQQLFHYILLKVFEDSKETFFKKFLKSRSAEREILPCASNRLRPAGCLEGVKSSLQGRFLLLHLFSKLHWAKGDRAQYFPTAGKY
jgi:hypothetical protein